LANLFSGRYDEAASWARKAALERPEGPVAARIEAIACALSGRIVEAQDALARMLAINPDVRLSHLARGVAVRLRRAEDRALFIEGLRRAGLPE
jgi:adenylate cyclase